MNRGRRGTPGGLVVAGFEPQPYGETWGTTEPFHGPGHVAAGGSARSPRLTHDGGETASARSPQPGPDGGNAESAHLPRTVPASGEAESAQSPRAPDDGADAACIRAVRAGDREAFAPLVERYQRRVYNLCLRYTGHPEDAADLTQEVFLRAFRGLGRFDLERSFATWLMQIAVNACRDASRRRAVRSREGLAANGAGASSGRRGEAGTGLAKGPGTGMADGPGGTPGARAGGRPQVGSPGPQAPGWAGTGPLAGEPVASGRDDPAQVVERREAVRRLEAALRQLPPGDRLLVLLVHHQGYSLKEAAAIVGQTTVAVKARLFRARRRLREWLQGHGQGQGHGQAQGNGQAQGHGHGQDPAGVPSRRRSP